MNFDIDDLEQMRERTFDVIVGRRDPVDCAEEGAPVGFRVVGAASEKFRRANRAFDVTAVKLAAQRGTPVDAKTDAGAEALVESGEQRRDAIVSACVVDWFGFTKGKTEPFPFSAENLERVLRAKPEWRDMLFAQIINDANFTKG